MFSETSSALYSVVTLCSITLCVCSVTTPFRPCAENMPTPLVVKFENSTRQPCVLRQQGDYSMSVQFVATKYLMFNLLAEVTLKNTDGTIIPYELNEQQSKVCENLLYGAYCPLYATEDVTYELTMHLRPDTPITRATIEVKIVDQTDDEVVVCFSTLAQLRPAIVS